MPSRTISPSREYDLLVENDQGLGRLLRDVVHLTPAAIAVVHGAHTLTYTELHWKALHLAYQLREVDYLLEEPTGILVNAGTSDIVTQVAVMYAGGTCVTLDPSLSNQQLESRLANVGSRYLLVDAANQDRLGSFRQIVVDDETLPSQEFRTHGARNYEFIETTLEHRTHLIHTSGTTSEPKAVEILARSILQVVYHAPFHALEASDSVLHVNNTSFDVSLFDIWAPLLRGARIVVLAKSLLLDLFILAENLERYQVNVWATTTAILNLAAISCPSVFSRLKLCFIGGEAANPKAIKKVLENGPPKQLINAFGPTETCIFALAHRVTLEDVQKDSVAIGKPIGNTTAYILNDSLEQVEDGETGELFIGGAGVARGYFNQPDKNAKAFLQVSGLTHSGEPIRLYRTGDIVVKSLEDGHVHYVGRCDHQVKVRGFRVELEAVEAALLKTERFHAATVLRIESPQEGAGGMLVAYAVPISTMKDPLVGIAEKLKILLPDYMIPRIELINELPLNSHAKVDRKKLTTLYLEGWNARLALAAAEAFPATTVLRLEQLWIEILASTATHYSLNDDFFLLGGTSLQAAVLIHQIRVNFRVEISSLTLYENSTLSAVADIIDQSQSGTSTPFRDETETWLADSRLADKLMPPAYEPQDWRHYTEGRVFITGVTGFVGAFFLHQLLQMPEVQKAGCLVRASDPSACFARIRQALEKYGLWRESFSRKILPLPGDLADEDLGLGNGRFRELADWASVVFHLGAHVNYTQPYSKHRPANVMGTLHVLRLVSVGRPKALHYVSSISCFGPTGFFTGTVRVQEDAILFPHLNALPYDHGYAQSQWVAEQMLWNSMDRGFPVAIYRPGFITGHSVTGVCNPDDFFSRLMVACLELGSYPLLPNQRKEFIPVDYVTSAILHMATNRNLGHAYHIVPKDRDASVDMIETFHLAACNGLPELEGVAYEEWVVRLSKSANETLKPLLPMLEEKIHNGMTRWELYEHMPVYETHNTDRALSDYPGGLKCPALDEKLMGKYLQYWKRK